MVELLARKRKRDPVQEISDAALGIGLGHNSKIDPDGRIVINQSRVKAWRECHQRHYYRYVLKQVRKKMKRPLVFGKAVHEIIEAHANGMDPMVKIEEIASKNRKMFAREIEVFGDIVGDLRYIMTEYFDYWHSHENKLKYTAINGKNSELTFEIEIESGLLWKGTIDAAGKYRVKLNALVEHKTMKKEWSEDERWRNMQSATYRRAMKMMGWPVPDGILWDYILSKPPTRPKLTSTGKLSTREIVTLPSVVDDFRREKGYKKAELAELYAAAEKNLDRYFTRVFTPANDAVEERIFADFMETAYEIAEFGDRKQAKNIGKHCGWCDYEPLCRTELTGGDVDYMLKREYQLETDEHKSRSEIRVED